MVTNTERHEPRISLNALSEYLTAGPSRRRTIVNQQKYPKPFQTAYYSEAESAIIAALATHSGEPLDNALIRMGAIPIKSSWDLGRREALIEAIKSFQLMRENGLLDDLPRSVPSQRRQKTLMVGGVSISVRPELLLQPEDSRVVGGMKLYFSKAVALDDERARYASALLHWFIESMHGSEASDYRSCFVLDILNRNIHSAPRTSRRSRQDIQAGCLEIAVLWKGLEKRTVLRTKQTETALQ